jgi:ribonuclease-3
MVTGGREAISLADLAALEEKLGIRFNELSLLEQALVHSSYVNENPDSAPISNERLEFLGDAVLGMVFAEKLYQDLPEISEGEMSKLRSYLVCRDTLAGVAEAIGLGEYIYLGKGEESNGGRHKLTNLADTIEAVTATVFLDQGLEVTRALVLRLFNTELARLANQGIAVDYKSQLQQLLQAEQQEAPLYHIIETTGPDHDRRFVAEVKVNDTVLGKGSGKSKKLAETEAAHQALEKFETDFT